KDRQDRAVAARIEELVRVPGCGEGAGLRLAVADHAGHDEIRIVERGTEGVYQSIAELTALVDRSGRLGRYVARHSAGERKLPEQFAQSLCVLPDLGIDLAVAALEIGIRHHGRSAMP